MSGPISITGTCRDGLRQYFLVYETHMLELDRHQWFDAINKYGVWIDFIQFEAKHHMMKSRKKQFKNRILDYSIVFPVGKIKHNLSIRRLFDKIPLKFKQLEFNFNQ